MRHPISLRLLTITLIVLGPVGSIEATAPLNSAPAVSNPQMTATLMRLPLQFEANQGQVDEQVRFLARGPGYRLFLTPSESVLVLQQREPTTEPAQRERGKPTARPDPPAIKQAVVRMTLEGANPAPTVESTEPLPGIVNYFIGNDPAKWRTHIPTYAKVQYQEVYPGIDLAYYGNQGTVEYDFIVAPGADPAQIRLAFEGASDIHVADSGDLLLTTALGEVRVQKPLVYQLGPDGHKTLVAGHYIMERQTANTLSVTQHSALSPPNSALNLQHSALPKIGIHLAAYDRSKPVVIDPVLLYSTYLGGSNAGFVEPVSSIAVDGAGQAYVTGETLSTDFPTAMPLQAALNGGSDAFVTKFNAAGTALLYSTYLGGSGGDGGGGIAVDGAGQAYVTGGTSSSDFPTVTPFQAAFAGGIGDAFVTKLNAAGTALLYSTYLGGSGQFGDGGSGIAVDGAGQVYVTGSTTSTDFPTATPFQPAHAGGDYDAFVTTLNAAGTALRYSTYLGGSGDELGLGIAVDRASQAYVTGQTQSPDFPTAMPLQATLVGPTDVFVTTLNAGGTALRFSTYLGGNGPNEWGISIAVDGAGQVYVTGMTESSDFPTVTPIQANHIGGIDPFVAKISALETNQPPVCRAAQANPAVLWAPNHQLVPIAILGVTDPDGDAVTITATGVTQDEPVIGTGDGHTSPDAVIQARAASVRAERAGNGNGRVYHVAFTADDGHGSSCSGAVTVSVPHSQKKGLTAIDDGTRYTSTSP